MRETSEAEKREAAARSEFMELMRKHPDKSEVEIFEMMKGTAA